MKGESKKALVRKNRTVERIDCHIKNPRNRFFTMVSIARDMLGNRNLLEEQLFAFGTSCVLQLKCKRAVSKQRGNPRFVHSS